MLHTWQQFRFQWLILIGITTVLSFPIIGGSVMVPFGGRITTYFPGCQAPAAAAMMIGPPTPMPLMYIPGASFSFRNGPPAHPGQWLLGNASMFTPCLIWVPCGLFGACLVPGPIPGGLTIMMHGSSL